MFYFMRRFAQSQFTQCNQRGFAEEILQGPFDLFAVVNDASLETMQESARREVDNNHLLCLLDYPVRNRFSHPDPGDFPNLIVQALQMLDIHSGQNVYSGVSNNFDIFPAFCAGRSRHIGVCKFINQAYLRMPGQNRVDVHFLEDGAAIWDFRSWYDFQAFCLRDGLLAAMGFKVTDNDIYSLKFQNLGFFEHFIGFADARRIAYV